MNMKDSSELRVGDEFGSESFLDEIGVEFGGSLHGLN